MFTSIKSTCNLIDKRLQTIEENKKSTASKEVIEKTNTDILNNIKAGFILLSEQSNNIKLLNKYENKIKKIKIESEM